MCVVAVGNGDDPVLITNFHGRHVLALDVGRRSEPSLIIACRHDAAVLEVLGNGSFCAAREIQALRDLRTDRIVLVSGNSDRRKNADDRNNDHQFDQGKTLLLFHFSTPNSR